MNDIFTWIPFYQELALALLRYKANRAPLVNWIYDELGVIARDDGKSLVSYLKQKDGSRIIDIDPFSVFGIFNRSISWEKKIELLQKFKEHFAISSEIPIDFNGIPTLDNRRSFFFSWEDNNEAIIESLWTLFEKVVKNVDIEESYNKVLDNGMSKYSLTMILFWIAPDYYLSLDSRNRSYLDIFGYPIEYSDLHYSNYKKLLDRINNDMNSKKIPFKSFLNLSYMAWTAATDSPTIWMWSGNEKTFTETKLKLGSSAQGKLDFSSFKSKKELVKAYQDIVENSDNSVPTMYWQFMNDIKLNDVVVVFGTRRVSGRNQHLLYGWGRIASNYIIDSSEDNPIQRDIVWHSPILDKPIEENKTKNALFFHSVTGIEAYNISRLLNINETYYTNNNGIIDSNIKEYKDLLSNCHNLILTGAPGTGKTYMAKEIAKEMIGAESIEFLGNDEHYGFVQFHPSYDYTDFVEGLRPTEDNGFELKNGIFKEFCLKAMQNYNDSKKSKQTLEQELSVKDIIDDFIDNSIENNVEFKTSGTKNAFHIIASTDRSIHVEVPGNEKTKVVKLPKSDLITLLDNEVSITGGKDIQIFFNRKYRTQQDSYTYVLLKEIRKLSSKKKKVEVQLVPLRNYVFVIDEINRGEISKIFGELFFSIDPGYRGEKGLVNTQYQNMIEEGDLFKNGFFVPKNVYIIGTMNDIDRSVESMDFAMRRRFAWKEITAEMSMSMLDTLKLPSDTKQILKNRMRNLNKAILNINGLNESYQIGAAYFMKYADYNDFEKLWDYHLRGLLFEYLRGSRNADADLKALKEAYDNEAE